MSDPFRDLFTTDVMDRLLSVRNPSDALRLRIETLTACGPPPATTPSIADRVRWLRARRAAWETYVHGAFACRLMEAIGASICASG